MSGEELSEGRRQGASHHPRRGPLRVLLLLSLLCLVTAGCLPKEVPPTRPAKVALVLGAGAAKGFAHIGVIKVLEMNRIPIHMVVGTSAGSFVGSLYAYGYDAYRLQAMAMALTRDDIADLSLPDNGFLKGEKLESYVNRAVKGTPIEKLRLPFYAVATNIITGERVVFGQGNTGMAVRASCSVPGVFQPPRFGAAAYVDGGVVDPLAVGVARDYGADVVIAVDISGGVGKTDPQTIFDTILKSIDIMYNRIATSQHARADVLIRPQVGHIAGSDLSKRHEAILAGEKAAAEAVPLIRALLEGRR